jgi:hypothetical protein
MSSGFIKNKRAAGELFHAESNYGKLFKDAISIEVSQLLKMLMLG